jgi:DNA-binding winged helix-turn-helix (wHTH) protein
MARAGAASTYRFADCEIDERLYELRRGGAVVKLEPKVFDVLRYLVRHRERVVPKDELLAQLWPGEFVSESVLPRCITVARKAIGDDSTAQRLIKTMHGRGYRFVAPLHDDVSAARSAEAATASAAADPARIFVGRAEAMRDLEAALAAAFADDGRLVLVVGEPGIGKTRTAEELARRATAAGAAVHTGRCHEGEGAPAFWLWTQVLRSVLAGVGTAAVTAELGDAARAAMQLVPELGGRVPAPPDASADALGGSTEARFRLFESVTMVLRHAARVAPIVIVLDDLHWADKPSLLLLQFLARELRGAAMLVVGTYRDVGLTRQHRSPRCSATSRASGCTTASCCVGSSPPTSRGSSRARAAAARRPRWSRRSTR